MADVYSKMLAMLDRIHMKMEAEGAACAKEAGQDENDLFNEIGCLIAEAKGEYKPCTCDEGGSAGCPEYDEAVPAYNRHKIALAVQDAVNMRALAREFVKVVDQAAEETRSTEATWADPAVRLFVNKLESLSHSNFNDHFSEAYKVCQEKANANP